MSCFSGGLTGLGAPGLALYGRRLVNLRLVETRTFPDGVLLTRYETRR